MAVNGTLVAASTLRNPAPGASGKPTQRLAVLYLASRLGTVFEPVSSQFVADLFGASVQMPARVRALWPSGITEQFPVRPNDFLVVPATSTTPGGTYSVHGVQPFPPRYLVLYLEIPLV